MKAQFVFLLMLITSLQISFRLFGQSYPARTYTEADGLPSNYILCGSQDQSGRMWFSTSKGPCFYDGVRWTGFEEKTELPNYRQTQLFPVGKSGMIMAGLNKDQFRVFSYSESWEEIQLEGTGLIDKLLPIFRIFQKNSRPQLAAITGDKISLWDLSSGKGGFISLPPGIEINRIQIDTIREKMLLLSSDGVLEYAFPQDGLHPSNYEKKYPGLNVIGLQRSEEEEFNYLLTPQGLYQYNGPDLVATHSINPYEASSNLLDARLAILAPGQMIYTLGSPLSMVSFNSGNCTSQRIHDASSYKVGTDIFIDQKENIWLSTLRGVVKINGLKFLNYQKKDGIFQDEITVVAPLGESKLVLGSYGSYAVANSKGEIRNVDLTPEVPDYLKLRYRVMDYALGSAGDVFLAVNNLGPVRVHPDGSFTLLSTDLKKVSSVYFSGDTLFAFVSKYGSFYSTDKGSSFFKWNDFQPFVRKVQKAKGKTYVLTRGGLYLFGSEFKPIPSPPYPNSEMYAVMEFDEKTLVGTLGGLHFIDPRDEKIKPFKLWDEYLNRPVYEMILDCNGALWLGTDMGVYRFSQGGVYHLTTSNGLIGNEINRRALFEDHENKIWIGNNFGLSIYDPSMDVQDQSPPKPIIASLYVDDEEMDPGSELRIPSGSKLKFLFSGTNFGNEEGLIFRTRMFPVEKEWEMLSPGQRGFKEYYNLEPGKYFFEFQVKEGDGIWSPVYASSQIQVLKPFYLSDVFLAGTLIFLVALGYGLNSYFSKQRNEKLLKKRVEEKTKILEQSKRLLIDQNLDLKKVNEELDHFVFRASHDLRAPIASMKGLIKLSLDETDPVALEKYLKIMDSSLDKQDDLIKEIIGHGRNKNTPVKIEQIDLRDFVRDILKKLRYDANASNIRFVTEFDINSQFFSDAGRLEIILTNIISNAIKYKGRNEPQVLISCAVHPKGANFRIKDNGVGIRKENLEKVFDLFFREHDELQCTGL